MNEKTLKEISKILDKDVDNIMKGDSLRIGSFLTDDDFYLFTERFPEDTLTITKKAVDLIEKIKLMENIPLRLLYMVPLPEFVFRMSRWYYANKYYYHAMNDVSAACKDICRKNAYNENTHRFLFKDKYVVKVPNLTIGIAEDMSAIKEFFVKKRATPYNPELVDYFAGRKFVHATTVNLTYPVYIRIFRTERPSYFTIDSMSVDDAIFMYMRKKMKLPIVACSEKGDNTKIYIDADDIEKVSPLLSLKKNDIWRHSVEMAKSQWYRVDKVEYFDRTITKEQGNGLYMYGEYERAAQKEIVLIDDNEMFVQWGRSILNLAGQFFFSGIDRCFELKKKKEQMVEDLPDMDR